MRCAACNSVLEEKWKFCASCGANIKNCSEALTKEITQSIISSLTGSENKGNLEINMLPNKTINNSQEDRKIHSKRQKQNSFLNTPNKPLEVVEPKTDITRLPGRIMLDTEIPGVKSGDSIKIMLLGESIEIRAVAPEKMYMKILHIPQNMRLAGSSFVDGKLRVALSEHLQMK
ncbi:MAG: zinc ribbon domain-containing protein [Nanoarchaeota archaeon]|nr:zinc ribbon domain-containing protein [Nanoarchaeota archaeon]MBU4301005.1 zinc ribbon domain-containing protein [Nanoarchaeota archaeon]MBU4452456.1 zinc ribbon domain-containing protein [Nanoarchaeota archaeon]MCG2723986.1 zinc ribbon domain-containing protein [archaeon]